MEKTKRKLVGFGKVSLLTVLLIVSLALSFSSFYVPAAHASPAYEDFTTYTEKDDNSHIERTAYHIDSTGERNEF